MTRESPVRHVRPCAQPAGSGRGASVELELWEAPGRRGPGGARPGQTQGRCKLGGGQPGRRARALTAPGMLLPEQEARAFARAGRPRGRGESAEPAAGLAGLGPRSPRLPGVRLLADSPAGPQPQPAPHLGTGQEVLPGAESHGRCLHAMRKPRLLTLRLSRCVDWEPRAVAAGLSPRVASEACLFALERTRDQGPRAAASERPPAFLQDAGSSTEPCSVDIALRCRSPARCPLAPRNSCAHLRCAVGEVAAVASQRVCPSCRFSAPSRHQA